MNTPHSQGKDARRKSSFTEGDMWHWQTQVGTFTIQPHPKSGGRWWLCLEEFGALGSYASARQAADDFYEKASGCDEWDLSPEIGPEDLSGWIPGRPS